MLLYYYYLSSANCLLHDFLYYIKFIILNKVILQAIKNILQIYEHNIENKKYHVF